MGWSELKEQGWEARPAQITKHCGQVIVVSALLKVESLQPLASLEVHGSDDTANQSCQGLAEVHLYDHWLKGFDNIISASAIMS